MPNDATGWYHCWTLWTRNTRLWELHKASIPLVTIHLCNVQQWYKYEQLITSAHSGWLVFILIIIRHWSTLRWRILRLNTRQLSTSNNFSRKRTNASPGLSYLLIICQRIISLKYCKSKYITNNYEWPATQQWTQLDHCQSLQFNSNKHLGVWTRHSTAQSDLRKNRSFRRLYYLRYIYYHILGQTNWPSLTAKPSQQ